jgi:hypothetical protein
MSPHPKVSALVAGLSLAGACGEQPYTPHEQQPVATVATGTLALYPVGEGQNLAQTFTPTENQWLGYLELPVGCTAGTLLNVRIREGLGGVVLFESNVAGLPEVVDDTFHLIQVFDPAVSSEGIRLQMDRQYAFELAAFAGPGSPDPATCGMAKGPAGDSYAGGQGWYVDLSGGPTPYLPLPDGAPGDDVDLPFVTLSR